MTAWQSPRPLPTPLAMSTRLPEPPATASDPKPSALPDRTSISKTEQLPKTTSTDPFNLPTPKLRFAIHDLTHDGATKFQREISAGTAIQDAIQTVLHLLYDTTSGKPIDHPGVRSITFILKSMDGVAYTTSNDLDDEHKEIYLSLEYIDKQPDERIRAEILGVITHEMVHVWQWFSDGVPGGLIEGIADYVRLKAGFSPPHWKNEPGESWDLGYERTGFFLDWLEQRYGSGKVVKINGLLKGKKYNSEIWRSVFGRSVEDLFKTYQESFKKNETADVDTVPQAKHV